MVLTLDQKNKIWNAVLSQIKKKPFYYGFFLIFQKSIRLLPDALLFIYYLFSKIFSFRQDIELPCYQASFP